MNFNKQEFRTPAVAGLFYPSDKTALSKIIDELFNSVTTHYIPNLKGLICPHAGYDFSGITAANAYKSLAGLPDIQTVMVLGPSHYVSFDGISLPDANFYQTPLGDVSISAKVHHLLGGPFILEPRCSMQRPSWWSQSSKSSPPFGEDTPETWEHSIEVQVPFLQKILSPNFSILPAIFGNADFSQAAEILDRQIDNQTIVVASSDLSHYHPYDVAKYLDNRCIEAILNLDMESMKTQEACGKLPILALMHLAVKKGWGAKLLDYRNSGDVSGNKNRVVGYTAIAFFEKEPGNYSTEERKFMLDLARTTLTNVVTNGNVSVIDSKAVPPKLTSNKACFVTLTIDDRLRGCIGHILPKEPLYQAVMDNTQSAALKDWRFPPVRPDELNKIKIEISVLTEPQPLSFHSHENLLNKLHPHIDGVILKIGPHEATFLPQVWKQLPNPVEFLNHLSEKACRDPLAWRNNETSVYTYQVEAFE